MAQISALEHILYVALKNCVGLTDITVEVDRHSLMLFNVNLHASNINFIACYFDVTNEGGWSPTRRLPRQA